MRLETIAHADYEKGLPQEGNVILGQENGSNIIVYQAFNKEIASFAVKEQKFGGSHYSLSRMTWIKPNFLWMMFRSGWATKANQEHILAIEMSKVGFLALLKEGVATSYSTDYVSEKEWRAALDGSDVRLQWDPDHDFRGKKLKRRAVQIGIKGKALERFNNEYIQSIQDISGFVAEQWALIKQKKENFLVMRESVIELADEALNKKMKMG